MRCFLKKSPNVPSFGGTLDGASVILGRESTSDKYYLKRDSPMKLDRSELAKYPDVLSKEPLRIVGHMSKKTATYLLESKILPAKYSGKKTRCYSIKKSDTLNYSMIWNNILKNTQPRQNGIPKRRNSRQNLTRFDSFLANQQIQLSCAGIMKKACSLR